MLEIANIKFRDKPVFLAPMEDVSDPPFRKICKRFGADLLYTEFISSGGLVHEARNSEMKLDFHESERPLAIQIFGGDIEQVRQATGIVSRVRPDIVDINFGCPVKKVVCRDGGAGILRNLDKMEAITRAVVEATDIPVTVKTRLGWNDQSIKILEVAHRLQGAGIRALAVHARTRSQMYKGEARWEWLRRLKNEPGISIPIIGNGDAATPQRIVDMFNATGVDAVMVGRGAIGNPWIFRDVRSLQESGELPERPGWDERMDVVREHLRLKCEWLGERTGVLEMRRMYGGYFKGFRNASRLRNLIMQETTEDGVLEVLMNFDINSPVAWAIPTGWKKAVLDN